MKYRKPRSWHTIVKQEGIRGVLLGEDPHVEMEYYKRVREGKEKIKTR